MPEKIIKPIDFKNLIDRDEIFDNILKKTRDLFPNFDGDILNSLVLWTFESGLEIGYKAGRMFSKFEKESDSIASKYINYIKTSIEDEKKMMKRKITKPSYLVEPE